MGKFLILLFILTIACCSLPHSNDPANSERKESILIPIPIKAGAPVTVDPDTCPPPLCITIPASTGQYLRKYSGVVKTIPLIAPSSNPIEFSVALENYSTDKGLALSSILCSCVDSKGNLWFGTDGGGVSRYDGKSFTSFTMGHGLANNSVFCIKEDRNGNLWFGTNEGGVSYYDGKTFTNFTVDDGLRNNSIRSITETKDGRLWFVTNSGVSIYDPTVSLNSSEKKFKDFTASMELPNSIVLCIAEDKAGNLWFGTKDNGIFECSDSSCSNYTALQGLSNNNAECIVEDDNGNFWIGGSGGLTKYDHQAFSVITSPHQLINSAIECITKDREGNLWFGSSSGIWKFNGKDFTSIATPDQLLNSSVKSITEDKSGNLWFGTYGSGVFLYAYSGCASVQGLADDVVNNIMEDADSTLWFCTVGGLSHYDGKNTTNFTTSQGLVSNTVYCIAKDDSGNYWLGTEEGACSYDGKCFTTYTAANGLADDNVWVITKDKKGNVWFGTNGGVTVYNHDEKLFKTYTSLQGLPADKTRCITEDVFGNIWFGTDGGGIARFDEKTFTIFKNEHGLANNSIFSITNDSKGNLWIGTAGGGVSILRKETIQSFNFIQNKKTKSIDPLFENFTTKEGLANDVVYDIVENKKGDIFLGTNNGFTLVHGGLPDAVKQINKSSIEYFNEHTGYPVNDINVSAMCLDSKGNLWAGTSDKTICFDNNAVLQNKAQPLVVIQNIKLNNQSIAWHDLAGTEINLQKPAINASSIPAYITEEAIVFGRTLTNAQRDSMRNLFSDVRFDSIIPFYSLPVNLVLPYKFNNLTFDYAAIEPARPYLVRYQFILEDYDKKWNPVTERTSASYGNLPEGDYTFKLKAQNPSGIWSETVSYSFTVLPPWYRTKWAYVFYLFLFLILIWSIVKIRERSLRYEKQVLEEKVEDRTNELRTEKEKSDKLLRNILPAEIAEELKTTGTSKPRAFNEVTVLFTDFKNFTGISEQLNAQELVALVDFCYGTFDKIISKHGVEKIKTIGDSYMCAGGLPKENKTHASDTLKAALEIRDFMLTEKGKRNQEGNLFFEIRIGIHTGPVVAGIVGEKKFAYDIWGDTVNIASRMESSSEVGKINVSGATYQFVKDKFSFVHRGKIQAKNKGEIDMYFVEA